MVFTGSHNLSLPALRQNDELFMRIHDNHTIHDGFYRHFLDAYSIGTRSRSSQRQEQDSRPGWAPRAAHPGDLPARCAAHMIARMGDRPRKRQRRARRNRASSTRQ